MPLPIAQHSWRKLGKFAAACALCCLPSVSFATDCTAWARFSTSDPHQQPLSVSLDKLQNHLNASPLNKGIIYGVSQKGRTLELDVLHFPGTVEALAGLRTVFQIGRIADESFDTLVFVDAQERLFSIAEPELRSLGCQFIWGRKGGQNPIALMRLFFHALKDAQTGRPAVAGFTGSLLGDTNLALSAHNEIFLPRWVLSAVEKP